jgi:iron complex outermembrane receptor protein
VFQTNQDKRSLRSALLLGAASAAVVGLSVPATAQETTETVVVTGSRIPQTGLYSTSPVTAIGQQEMKFEGTTNVENLINNLPEAFADQGSAVSNGSTGTATVNLRNLGANRTLVLVDGKRLMPGDPNSAGSDSVAPDLNFIPAALVDHVEVVTGGASAVYGSDAVAGVVNFIMRKDFEGVEFDGTWSEAQHDQHNSFINTLISQSATPIKEPSGSTWDGRDVDATMIMGVNSPNGKGNVTAYAGYRNVQAVTQDQRDFSSCSMTINGYSSPHPFGNYFCGGSSTNPGGRFITAFGGNGGDLEATANGTMTPYSQGKFGFNFAPYNFLQRPDERYTGGVMGHYEVNPAVDFYTSVMFMDDHTVAQIAPSGLFLGTPFSTNCDNPFLTYNGSNGSGDAICGSKGPQIASFLVGRRTTDIGPRQDNLRHTDYRIILGMRGDLGSGWSYDVFAQYGTTIYQEEFLHDVSNLRAENALNVHLDANGVPQCDVFLSGADAACQPLNIFSAGAASPGSLNYIQANGFKEGSTVEQIVGGTLTGDLGAWGFQSPWAKNPVAVSLGAEYRQEALELRVDNEFQTGDLAGQGGPTLPVAGAYHVSEGYGEVRVPIVQNMPFFEDLTANAGYRYSSYSTAAGGVSTYKLGLEWQMIDDFRLRGSFQKAVRAPNVIELFSAPASGLWVGIDPCAGSKPAYSEAQCAHTGITKGEYGNVTQCSAAQCNALFAGNANLKPEVADTYSVGAVFTPTFIDGFTLTVDYFDIKINKFISVVPQAVKVGVCAITGTTYCSDLTRGPGGILFGSVAFVNSPTVNTGFLHEKGLDFEANYNADLENWGMGPNGSLSFNFIGTKTNNLITEPTSPQLLSSAGFQTTYDCVGLFGPVCGTPTPEWRHRLRVTWTSPWDFDFSVAWRHLSGVALDLNENNNLLNQECQAYGVTGACGDKLDGNIPAFDYFDLAVGWNVREGISLHAGVNNVFDKDPPLVDTNNLGVSGPPFGNANTFPQVYDSLGRVIFVNATIKY